jgi:hypothetical protein
MKKVTGHIASPSKNQNSQPTENGQEEGEKSHFQGTAKEVEQRETNESDATNEK